MEHTRLGTNATVEPLVLSLHERLRQIAVLGKTGHTPADLKLLVAHQANLRIAEVIQRSLELRDDQVYNNIMWYGNTTAATIPIALDECVRAGRLARGDLIALTAFGSGFLWGSAALRW